MTQPFHIPGAPQGLLDAINARRASIPAGMTMTLGAPEGGTEGAPEGKVEGAPEGGAPKVEVAKVDGAPEADAGDMTKLPKWAQTLITGLRSENGDARTNAKAAAAEEARKQMAQEIGKALGLVKSDEPVDPAKLAAQVEKATAETADTKRELAVYRLSGKNGGDPDSLLDSNSFMRSIAGLGPTDEAKIAAAITEAVKGNTKLAAAPRAGSRSGTDTGGTGERTVTKEVFDKMSGAERNALFNSNPDLYARLSGRAA